MSLTKVGLTKDFPVNRTTKVTVNNKNICIAHWDDGFYAFDDGCTHAYAPLSDNDIEEGVLECPLHGARFSVTTGQALTLPAVKGLQMYAVEVNGDELFISLS